MDKLRALFDQNRIDFERLNDESNQRHAEHMAALDALHDNLDPRSKLERVSQRILEAEQRKLERAERWRQLDAKWKADEELFFNMYGITREEVMAGKSPKFYPSRAESNHTVNPNPPKAVVPEVVAIHIVDSATEEFLEVPHALIPDVVPAATIVFPLQVPDLSDEIVDVKVDIGVDPIATSVELFVDSIDEEPIEVKAHFAKVQSKGSNVQLTEFHALSYFDPFSVHCTPLDFVVADFYTHDVSFTCGVLIMSCYVVVWMHGSQIFVFDPG